MSDYSANDDIKLYEEWCEWNKNNEPISFTEYCYQQGRADERDRIVEELENRIAEETLGRNVSDVGIGLKIALKVVRGGKNVQ